MMLPVNDVSLPGAAEGSERAAMVAAACLFHGFSDPSRLVILRHLVLGGHRVIDLVEHLGLAQSTVSKHLACLRDCGLVDVRAQGRASVYSLTHPEAVLDLLGAAERLLGLTGDAVTLCPVFGVEATLGQAGGDEHGAAAGGRGGAPGASEGAPGERAGQRGAATAQPGPVRR